jgi:hypothetical protein
MNEIQENNIKLEIARLEDKVINAKIYNIFDAKTYLNAVSQVYQKIATPVDKENKLSKQNFIYLTILALIAFFFGFIPYILSALNINPQSFGIALGMSIFAVSLVFIFGKIFTRKMTGDAKENDKEPLNEERKKVVQKVFENVQTCSEVFKEYFSSVCKYMYYHSKLRGKVLKESNKNKRLSLQERHLAFVSDTMNHNRTLIKLYGQTDIASLSQKTSANVHDDFITKQPSDCEIYELVISTHGNTLEFLNTGEILNAPYNFITGLSINREELYDKAGGR